MCCLAAPIVAGSGSAWPDICRRWLPNWLPENSLASLMFSSICDGDCQVLACDRAAAAATWLPETSTAAASTKAAMTCSRNS